MLVEGGQHVDAAGRLQRQFVAVPLALLDLVPVLPDDLRQLLTPNALKQHIPSLLSSSFGAVGINN